MKYNLITDERGIQGSQSWLSFRKNTISATNAAPIMGLSPFKTAYSLWQEKLDLIEPEPENAKMREGTRLEVEARDYFNEVMKDTFKPVVIQHSVNEWQIASLDGMNEKGEILEIKCGAKSHEEALNKVIAPYYYSQLQHQMFCSGEDHIWYLSYRSKEDNVYWRVDRDNAFIDKMILAEKEFYECLKTKTPPELTDKDYVTREDKDWRIHAEIYRETKFRLKEYEKKEADLKLKLIQLSNGASCKGYGVRVGKVVRRGNVDYSSIKELEGVDLSNYRKRNVEYWSVRDE